MCSLNLEANQVSFVLQVGAALLLEIDHIVQHNVDLFLEILLALAQPNCYRYGGSAEPYIFKGVIKMPTLRRIRLEVGNYEFSLSSYQVF